MNHIRTFFLLLFFILSIAISFSVGAFIFFIHDYDLDLTLLLQRNTGTASIVFDDEGNELTRFQLERCEPVNLQDLPQHLVQAFVAAEDWYFFSHHGISYKGIIRSLLVNLYYAKKAQGASTITQQLVKLLFFDSQKTFARKIKEQLYAVLLEKKCTKEQILEAYLNTIYFGNGIYGVKAASKSFWSKNVEDLSIAESAVLAGVVCSPNRYCPLTYPLCAQKRRNLVLRNMVKLQFLSQEEYEKIISTPLDLLPSKNNPCCVPHVREMLRTLLEKKLGKKKLYSGGFQIYTTINRTFQNNANALFLKRCANLRRSLKSEIDGALLCIEHSTGAIKALVGGYDFNSSKFNRATQAHRQMGSTIKPLLYAIALQDGASLTDIIVDEPLELEYAGTVWKPRNYNYKFVGPVTRAYALSHSNNIIAIKTFLSLDVQQLLLLINNCGILAPKHTYPSLALGCINATLQEITGMFAIFAHDGLFVDSYLIHSIKDSTGKKIYRHHSKPKRVLPSSIVGQIGSVLQHSLQRMKHIQGFTLSDIQTMSKTGTTNDSRTCWYVGSTPVYTTGVFIGCDDNRSLGKNILSSRAALPLWLDFVNTLPKEKKYFIVDPSLKKTIINQKTGLLTNETDPEAVIIMCA